jgi:outer membrane lipoprotein SlyB
MDTSAFDDLGTKKNPLSRKAFTQFKKDIVSKAPVKKALKIGGPVLAVAGSALDFRDTYKRSQAQGDTKARSLGKGLSRVAGGLIGGALGATAGSAVAPGAGTYIGGYGGYVAGQELGQKAFDTLTTRKGRKQLVKSFKNFRQRAMKPIGS